jgi:uncharacterized protein YdhG (YjbR/CyaY superfamily)
MKIEANSPEQYLERIPEDRKPAMNRLRRTILANLPNGFKEEMSYGMIGYVVPHSLYPQGYHCNPKLPLPFLAIASQKHFVAFYHSGIYAKKEIRDWVTTEFPKHSELKLDMGKSCVRFNKPDKIPFELIAQLLTKISVGEWIEIYETNLKNRK